MSGTPEKILEHLLETIKLDSNGNDAIGGSRQASSGLFCFLFYSATQMNRIDLAGWFTVSVLVFVYSLQIPA